MVSKQNLQFQPAPTYRLPVMGAVLQVTGAVWPKVTHGVTHVTPYAHHFGSNGLSMWFIFAFDKYNILWMHFICYENMIINVSFSLLWLQMIIESSTVKVKELFIQRFTNPLKNASYPTSIVFKGLRKSRVGLLKTSYWILLSNQSLYTV